MSESKGHALSRVGGDPGVEMDDLDRQLLDLIQSDFPRVSRPYLALAQQLGTTEEEVLKRLARMVEKGIIRRLGGIFDSRRLGYTGTLCALHVPEERIEEVARVINSYPGVTHNYLREHRLNMWFTLLAPGTEHLERIIAEIKAQTGIAEIHSLPAEKIFKIKVKFRLTDAGEV
ncbi:MAG: AsnC family transcriptional regulator [Bacillota bacterium]|uniref:siroheme decarboxylase subunit alpha n=1 Tax=Desulfurispora thermophila TaxID=265470 RepID=UPI0003625568|nr:AsnC family transcriptional regulator [Desulfurispora thermophila]